MADLDGDVETDESSLEEESIPADEAGEEEPDVTEEEKSAVGEQEEKKDRISKELAAIRKRRTSTDGRRFPAATEDYVLLMGLGYGGLYLLLLLGLSSGAFGDEMSKSTWFDSSMSETFFDISEEVCEDRSKTPWVHVYVDNNALDVKMRAYNLPDGVPMTEWVLSDADGVEVSNGSVLKEYTFFNFGAESAGEYKINIEIRVYNDSGLDYKIASVDNTTNLTPEFTLPDSLDLTIASEENTMAFLPWVDAEVKKAGELVDDGPRPCWNAQDLGNWGWVLMGAELGGGRETAMLTGGAAGVPAWYMAFVSLSLSAISLLILYPIMYKVYHRDSDDMLSHDHIERLTRDTIRTSAEELELVIDWDLFGFKERDLSIDIMVPYENTSATMLPSADVRAEILHKLLEEFTLFSVFKPVQMTARAVGATASIDFETGIGVGVDDMGERDVVESGQGAGHVVSDYSTFFRDLHILSRVEDDVRDILNDYFMSRSDVELLMATVVSDEERLSVSVIYKPTMKLAILRFKTKADLIEDELKAELNENLAGILGERKLYIRTRNNLEKFSKKAGAGRVERTSSDPDRVAAVARQGGIAGRMLQTKLFGDILSTVEYTANEKRDFINRWGFWGLIVFVWIPFMASGVLVGAMLGLLSRMKFIRVLLACLFGGTVASITWAYTAEGIVTIMHKYKLELMIPIAIIAFVGMAVLHMRSTKARRQAELFEDEMFNVFHENIEEKYGITD
jgi:hypothetical protein